MKLGIDNALAGAAALVDGEKLVSHFAFRSKKVAGTNIIDSPSFVEWLKEVKQHVDEVLVERFLTQQGGKTTAATIASTGGSFHLILNSLILAGYDPNILLSIRPTGWQKIWWGCGNFPCKRSVALDPYGTPVMVIKPNNKLDLHEVIPLRDVYTTESRENELGNLTAYPKSKLQKIHKPSMVLAPMLWPDYDFRISDKGKIVRDGIADAALIALSMSTRRKDLDFK